MGLARNPDILKLWREDPTPHYLGDKVFPGPGINITRRTHPEFGFQAILSCDTGVVGSGGLVIEVRGTAEIPNVASLILVDASEMPAIIILPHPAEVTGWLSVVGVDVSCGITLKTANEDDPAPLTAQSKEEKKEKKGKKKKTDDPADTRTYIFNKENLEFRSAGDAFIFASNRRDAWYCVGRYAADWY